MNQLSAIGVNHTGFTKLLSPHFYVQMVCSRLEYGLAINKFTSFLYNKLEDARNRYVRRAFDVSAPKFLLRLLSLPDDALLMKLLPYIRTSSSRSQCHSELHSLDNKRFRNLQQQFLRDNLNACRSAPNNSTSLSLCRPTISIDPILWLPMSFVERRRCIHWRLGWILNGYFTYCTTHPSQHLTRRHAIICLQIHRRLQMPETIEDPLSFLLDQLPIKKPASSYSVSPWHIQRPFICLILHKLDQLQHNKPIRPISPNPGQRLLDWLSPSPTPSV
ncbi:MAG: hypothetical protein EXX96DRAFT_601922 [Benjaminiella poitrasii]|nr:MAG: hypothetical protein EXX96DRAFT_601922 [Benjaminiella poitrasii]